QAVETVVAHAQAGIDPRQAGDEALVEQRYAEVVGKAVLAQGRSAVGDYLDAVLRAVVEGGVGDTGTAPLDQNGAEVRLAGAVMLEGAAVGQVHVAKRRLAAGAEIDARPTAGGGPDRGQGHGRRRRAVHGDGTIGDHAGVGRGLNGRASVHRHAGRRADD